MAAVRKQRSQESLAISWGQRHKYQTLGLPRQPGTERPRSNENEDTDGFSPQDIFCLLILLQAKQLNKPTNKGDKSRVSQSHMVKIRQILWIYQERVALANTLGFQLGPLQDYSLEARINNIQNFIKTAAQPQTSSLPDWSKADCCIYPVHN